ncbi:MAG: hypothetical protein NTY59_07670 [Alphaproteobacteria bacterium]|nr:hypothetical protein [Alphaproteobacteria bacterium]
MNTLTKSLLFGASLLTVSGAAFAADQKPQRTWVQPPAWVMLLDRGDQTTTISLDRMAYVEQAINPDREANVAEAK